MAAAADATKADATLRFAPLNGALDVGFFSELGRRKLHVYGLSDAPVPIAGCLARAERRDAACPLCLSADAFELPLSVPPSMSMARGTLRNANTLDDFKEWDKAQLLQESAREIWDDIRTGEALREPERLLRFLLLTFADLKTHKYYYWFAFPAFALAPPPTQLAPPTPLTSLLNEDQVKELVAGHAALAATATDVSDADATTAPSSAARAPPFFAVRLPTDSAGTIEVGPLSCFSPWRRAAKDAGGGEAMLAFCDPCPMPSHPGWPLRNLLALAATLVDGDPTVRVICFREPPPGASTTAAASSLSIVLSVRVPPPAPELPAVVGWEKNSNGKLGPRLMDLSAQMDPHALAEASVDLNLRLMRWRLMPSLKTEQVAATKCLLMGAGTLGCAVARNLIGWGVRTVTFVDSGVVSYSNPVRQSLFTFDDCLDGGKPKAQAAADRLKLIFPSVDATAHRLAIPMPGHSVTQNEAAAVQADCEALSALVAAHDVVFLLTDTRESRWLPALLAAHHGKIAINAALGFDSLMVMRHGAPAAVCSPVGKPSAPTASADATARLGCYFCNDVVAPANSMIRRTLDQQCTVSRPGLAYIASATAVELTVSLLHHPHGMHAAADVGADADAPPAAAVRPCQRVQRGRCGRAAP